MKIKPADIQPGRTYVRTAAGPDGAPRESRRTVLSDADMRGTGQRDRDTLTYRVDAGRGVGRAYVCTRKAFAAWATADVTPDQPAAADGEVTP